MLRLTCLFFCLITALGCKKKGCLDRLASNYDSEAKKEATCYYDGRFVLYVDEASAARYKNIVLDFYLDNERVATDSALTGVAGKIDCDDARGKTFTRSLGENTSGRVHYKVMDRKQLKTLADSSINLYGGYCVSQKMNLP
jgi:hypothetical protein